MKKWQVIIWLLLFFPLGLYYMFKYTEWAKPVKYGVTAFFTLILLVSGVELWANLFYLSSIFVIMIGIFSIIRTRNRRKGVITFALGLSLLFVTSPIIEAQVAEQNRLEQLELEKQAQAEAEVKRLAEEARQEELARQEEKDRKEAEEERIAEEKKLKKQAENAVRRVEGKPTQRNFEDAVKYLEGLKSKDSALTARLEKIKPVVIAYEEAFALAKETVLKAEAEKDRAIYNDAILLVANLPISNKGLTARLETLDDKLTEIEEEKRIAAEKAAEEEQRQIAQAEEERRVAAEAQAAEAEAEAQRQAAAASQQQASSSHANAAVAPPAPAPPVVPVDNVTRVVYIAPQSGTKYHFDPNCRGLNNANSIQEMSLDQAIAANYGLCGWED